MAKKEDLSKIVGSENVFNDPDTLKEYSRDMSFVRSIMPRYVVKPGNGDEVQRLVKWANETLTPLVPVSSGRPHLRGDTVPGTGGAVIVDLSGMKKIIRIDQFERVAMVEPGVTFGELLPELEKEGIRFNMPLLPRSSKSIVGSMLEREPVLMPGYHWDMSDPLGCVEVIFGTGDLFRTGASAGPGPVEEQWKTGEAQKQGSGPAQTDLYRIIQGSQGTMGIVNWATLRCELLPSLEESFLVGSAKAADLFEFVHWLVRRRLVTECLILNNSNLAAILANKWPDEYLRLRDNLPPWVLFFSIAGYKYFPEERVEWQVEQVTGLAQRFQVEPVKLIGGVSASELSRILKKPSDEPYWKLRYQGSCCDIFFLATYDRLSELIEVMYNVATRHGYPVPDIGVYLQPIVQGTSYHCEFNLPFNPDESKGVARIQGFYLDASKTLMNRGGFFARPYGAWADMAYRRDGETATALKKVKGIFDPNNIMNPGKLCF